MESARQIVKVAFFITVLFELQFTRSDFGKEKVALCHIYFTSTNTVLGSSDVWTWFDSKYKKDTTRLFSPGPLGNQLFYKASSFELPVTEISTRTYHFYSSCCGVWSLAKFPLVLSWVVWSDFILSKVNRTDTIKWDAELNSSYHCLHHLLFQMPSWLLPGDLGRRTSLAGCATSHSGEIRTGGLWMQSSTHQISRGLCEHLSQKTRVSWPIGGKVREQYGKCFVSTS